MPKVKSFDALSALKKSAQLQEGMDIIPDDMQNTVVPVIDITPRFHRVCNIVKRAIASNATSSTLYTTPSDQDFFLVAASISVIKDATATSVSSRIPIVIEGITVNILEIPGFTLTAQDARLSISFPYPIKIDRSAALTVTNTTNVGNVSAAATIYGYTVSNPQGN